MTTIWYLKSGYLYADYEAKYQLKDDIMYFNNEIKFKVMPENYENEHTITILDKKFIDSTLYESLIKRKIDEQDIIYEKIKDNKFISIKNIYHNWTIKDFKINYNILNRASIVNPYQIIKDNDTYYFKKIDEIQYYGINLIDLNTQIFDNREILILVTKYKSDTECNILIEESGFNFIKESFRNKIKNITYYYKEDNNKIYNLNNPISINNHFNSIFTMAYNQYEFIILKMCGDDICIKYYNMETDTCDKYIAKLDEFNNNSINLFNEDDD